MSSFRQLLAKLANYLVVRAGWTSLSDAGLCACCRPGARLVRLACLRLLTGSGPGFVKLSSGPAFCQTNLSSSGRQGLVVRSVVRSNSSPSPSVRPYHQTVQTSSDQARQTRRQEPGPYCQTVQSSSSDHQVPVRVRSSWSGQNRFRRRQAVSVQVFRLCLSKLACPDFLSLGSRLVLVLVRTVRSS